MTRSILTGLAFAVAAVVLSGTGCQSTGVGDPCTPEAEYDQTFLGFDSREVNVESKSFQCQTRLCLVNHFQGRVSCPYGQDTMGNGPAVGPRQTKGCFTPAGSNFPVGFDTNGAQLDPNVPPAVPPQCVNRNASNAVYCSCRCQNAQGATNDGSNYCTCPTSFHCAQLVAPIGASNEGLTGGYCVKDSTDYDPAVGCSADLCDPVLGNGNGNCGKVAYK
jgi:hypothetical protein